MNSDAERLRLMLSDYQYALEHNSNSDDKIELLQIHKKEFFNNYTQNDAEIIDALTLPISERIQGNTMEKILSLREKGYGFDNQTYKGKNREYYEELRVSINQKISSTKDDLEKIEMIEQYGSELVEAGRFFELLDLFKIVKRDDVKEEYAIFMGANYTV